MAEWSQAEHGIERVAVVDIDVHHGNGTQAAFAKNPTTFYASTHQVRRWGKAPHPFFEHNRRWVIWAGLLSVTVALKS